MWISKHTLPLLLILLPLLLAFHPASFHHRRAACLGKYGVCTHRGQKPYEPQPAPSNPLNVTPAQPSPDPYVPSPRPRMWHPKA